MYKNWGLHKMRSYAMEDSVASTGMVADKVCKRFLIFENHNLYTTTDIRQSGETTFDQIESRAKPWQIGTFACMVTIDAIFWNFFFASMPFNLWYSLSANFFLHWACKVITAGSILSTSNSSRKSSRSHFAISTNLCWQLLHSSLREWFIIIAKIIETLSLDTD